MNYTIKYQITSGIGPGFKHTGSTTIELDPEKDLKAQAKTWVYDHDSYADERIDPRVRVTSIRPVG